MKRFALGQSPLVVPEIALGCMRLASMEPAKLDEHLDTALGLGINFFDHADIYGAGKCEEVFAASVKRLGIAREDLILQSKCGIRKGFFDFSKPHLLSSVEGILNRLDTDYLDVLLLHRPDALMEPKEVAEAFAELQASGKVRYFGVSNFSPSQVELLKRALTVDLHVNQLQFGLMHSGMVDQGLTVNMRHENGLDRDGGVLDYCRLNRLTIQAWSPFQFGRIEGPFLDNPAFPEINAALDDVAERLGITKTGLAIAWIQRHPAQMQSIIGTTTPRRLREVVAGCRVELSREDWYALYRAAGNIVP